jgi:hypothetical protein
MPNEVENLLTLSGKPADVEAVTRLLASEEGPLDFNRVSPYPEHFAVLDRAAEEYVAKHGFAGAPKDGYHHGGLDWRCDNWGTKWNAYGVAGPMQPVTPGPFDGAVAHYIFWTAWGPPLPFLEALAERFPRLYITLTTWDRNVRSLSEVSYLPRHGREPIDSRRETFDTEYEGNRGG